MTHDIWMWVLGIAIGIIGGLGGFLMSMLFRDLHEMEREMLESGQRLARVEAFIEIWGQNLMKVMHRFDDAHKADALFDEYKRRNGELTVGQWLKLKEIYMKVIEEGESKHSYGERVGATGIVAFCEHKLKGFAHTELALLANSNNTKQP